MSLPQIFGCAALALIIAVPSAWASNGGKFSDILNEVGDYGRAISVARACGLSAERAERAVSMVMVYAYAAAQPKFSDVDRKRMFLLEVVERLSRKHKVGKPGKRLCARSLKAIDYLSARLDDAVRHAG